MYDKEDCDLALEEGRTLGFLGIPTGLEQACNILMVKANHYFTQGKDDLAKTLRDISQELGARSRETRKTYDEKVQYHKQNQDED